MRRDIRLILTGGTIDKIHDSFAESLAFAADGSSQIPTLLEEARCHHATLDMLLQKDSLDFDDADRSAIAVAVRDAPEKAIVITHGTGTMEQTAKWLAVENSDKTIVLTGAMRPFSLSRSDGPFNLGGAIIAAQILPEGVYGVMNGRVFPASELHKNTDAGRFDL